MSHTELTVDVTYTDLGGKQETRSRLLLAPSKIGELDYYVSMSEAVFVPSNPAGTPWGW